MLVASLADRSLAASEREAAEALVASCGLCAALHADLLALRAATRAMPTPARPRDYTLTPADAARLRPAGWRRLRRRLRVVARRLQPPARGRTDDARPGRVCSSATVPSVLVLGARRSGPRPTAGRRERRPRPSRRRHESRPEAGSVASGGARRAAGAPSAGPAPAAAASPQPRPLPARPVRARSRGRPPVRAPGSGSRPGRVVEWLVEGDRRPRQATPTASTRMPAPKTAVAAATQPGISPLTRRVRWSCSSPASAVRRPLGAHAASAH